MRLDDVELAIAAAEAGADVLRAVYGSPLTQFAKSDWDFATQADLESERAILDVLRAARPTDGLLGEEAGQIGASHSRRTWLVDPLCGTLNFAAGTPLASVNVALRIDDDIVIAAVAELLAARVFWTDGTAAWVRRAGHDEPITPSAASRLVDLNLDPPYPNGARFTTARLAAAPEFGRSFRTRVLSTTLAVAWVANGSRAGYITDGQLRDSVHFAGAIALCRAAGCVVTGLQGQPLHTGVNGLVVAADLQTHATIIAIINEQFAQSAAAAGITCDGPGCFG